MWEDLGSLDWIDGENITKVTWSKDLKMHEIWSGGFPRTAGFNWRRDPDLRCVPGTSREQEGSGGSRGQADRWARRREPSSLARLAGHWGLRWGYEHRMDTLQGG